MADDEMISSDPRPRDAHSVQRCYLLQQGRGPYDDFCWSEAQRQRLGEGEGHGQADHGPQGDHEFRSMAASSSSLEQSDYSQTVLAANVAPPASNAASPGACIEAPRLHFLKRRLRLLPVLHRPGSQYHAPRSRHRQNTAGPRRQLMSYDFQLIVYAFGAMVMGGGSRWESRRHPHSERRSQRKQKQNKGCSKQGRRRRHTTSPWCCRRGQRGRLRPHRPLAAPAWPRRRRCRRPYRLKTTSATSATSLRTLGCRIEPPTLLTHPLLSRPLMMRPHDFVTNCWLPHNHGNDVYSLQLAVALHDMLDITTMATTLAAC